LAKDIRFAIVLALGGATIAAAAVPTLWYHGIIWSGIGVPSRDAGPLWLILMLASLSLASYVMRPATFEHIALFVLIYGAAVFVGGMFVSMAVAASYGFGP
jgi:hypothetical protein